MENKLKKKVEKTKRKISGLETKKNNIISDSKFWIPGKKRESSSDSGSVEQSDLKQNGKINNDRKNKNLKATRNYYGDDKKSELSDFERGYIEGQKSCQNRMPSNGYDSDHGDYEPRFGRMHLPIDEYRKKQYYERNDQVNSRPDINNSSRSDNSAREEYPEYQVRETRFSGLDIKDNKSGKKNKEGTLSKKDRQSFNASTKVNGNNKISGNRNRRGY